MKPSTENVQFFLVRRQSNGSPTFEKVIQTSQIYRDIVPIINLRAYPCRIAPVQEFFLGIFVAHNTFADFVLKYHSARLVSRRKLIFETEDTLFLHAAASHSFSMLLCGIRAFIDRTESEVKRLHGANSPAYRNFKRAITGFYDGDPLYRIADKLRNYGLHYDLALSDWEEVDDASVAGGFKLVPFVVSERLLETGFDWTAKVRTDIKNMGARLPVAHLITKYASYAKDTYVRFIEHEAQDLHEIGDRFQKVRKTLRLPEHSHLAFRSIEQDASETVLFPFEEMDNVIAIDKRIRSSF